jgi:hypothetical protein
MSPTLKPPDPRQCEIVGELIAWHVNGTLGPADRAVVDAHTAVCETCRTTLAVERRLVEGMRAPRGNIEQSPHAGWQKLLARLDAEETATALRDREAAKAEVSRALGHGSITSREPAPARATRSRVNWPAALGAAVAVQAAAIAVLAVALVRHRQEYEAPRYTTRSEGDPTLAARGPLVRIAFDSSVDEVTARGIATQAGAQPLAGPSPNNVYTFEFAKGVAAGGALDQKVDELRRQAHVLLVEPVIVGYPRTEQ